MDRPLINDINLKQALIEFKDNYDERIDDIDLRSVIGEELDYGYFGLSGGQTVGLDFDAPIRFNSTILSKGVTLSNYGVNLKKGKTYKLTVFIRHGGVTIQCGFRLYDNILSTVIGGELYAPSTNDTSTANSANSMSCIYKPYVDTNVTLIITKPYTTSKVPSTISASSTFIIVEEIGRISIHNKNEIKVTTLLEERAGSVGHYDLTDSIDNYDMVFVYGTPDTTTGLNHFESTTNFFTKFNSIGYTGASKYHLYFPIDTSNYEGDGVVGGRIGLSFYNPRKLSIDFLSVGETDYTSLHVDRVVGVKYGSSSPSDLNPNNTNNTAISYNPYSGAINSSCVTQLHTHTTNSDGVDTVNDVIIDYKDKGYHALAITDHNKNTQHASSEMIAIQGNEVTLSSAHLNSLFCEYSHGSQTNVQVIINEIKSMGGLVLLNHPYWKNLLPIETIENYYNYNAIEIFNSATESHFIDGSGYAVDMWDYLLTNNSKYIYGIATDDYHRTNNFFRKNIGRIVVFSEKTEDAIKKAIQDGCFVADVGCNDIVHTPITINNSTIMLNCPNAQKIRFIGDNGVLLRENMGESAFYDFSLDKPSYVRCEVVGKYTDGFSKSTDNWVFPYGDWTYGDGVLKNTSMRNSPESNAKLLKPIEGDLDLYYEAQAVLNDEVSPVSYIGNTFHSFIASSTDGVSALFAGYGVNISLVNNSIVLYRCDNRAVTNLSELDFTTNINVWYCVRIKYTNGTIHVKVWERGTIEPDWMIQVDDDTYSHGWCSLTGANVVSEYDSFELVGIKSYYQPIVTNYS